MWTMGLGPGQVAAAMTLALVVGTLFGTAALLVSFRLMQRFLPPPVIIVAVVATGTLASLLAWTAVSAAVAAGLWLPPYTALVVQIAAAVAVAGWLLDARVRSPAGERIGFQRAMVVVAPAQVLAGIAAALALFAGVVAFAR